VLGREALPSHLSAPREIEHWPVELPQTGFSLDEALEQIEQRYVQMALERTRGVQTRAAKLLGLSFRQFRYKLQKFAQRK
ncbi:MAG: helix-turn-helix domain-containing protein, partial [Candidatus Rokubacteria bacterium]|nr:helix-turn-helix domain-containing protein [Candidatus Rokubacteria bacterium]